MKGGRIGGRVVAVVIILVGECGGVAQHQILVIPQADNSSGGGGGRCGQRAEGSSCRAQTG